MVRWRSGNAGVCKTSMRGFDSRSHLQEITRARVAELVYAQDLKSWARKGLRVQVPPRAPKNSPNRGVFYLLNYSVSASAGASLPFGASVNCLIDKPKRCSAGSIEMTLNSYSSPTLTTSSACFTGS